MSYPGGGGGGGAGVEDQVGAGAGGDVEFCPTRANLHWSQAQYDRVEFADFNHVQVAEYGQVQYFQPSDGEEGEEGEDGEGETFFLLFCCSCFLVSFVTG